eukprot:TRINITY_DN3142_c0_g5_i2.p1 TRINITY_DN3142_c0_g5~~TRINITY_DN3142_c0_g5_i2.p1  ORF type:complete len:958 (+),score=202.38 TRINITY_DN3142_c0_g5_i2:341-3214(+)
MGVSANKFTIDRGIIDVYTFKGPRPVRLLDITKLVEDSRRVLVSASWARGTFQDSIGSATTFHLPVDGTVDTMISFERGSSLNGTINVVKPITSLRSSDKQTKEALKRGAWNGPIESLALIPTSNFDRDVMLVPAKALIEAGCFISGWSISSSTSQILDVFSYEKNVLLKVQFSVTSPENTDALPMVVSFSFIALPEVPMRSRIYDDRLRYFTVDYVDLGQAQTKDGEIKNVKRTVDAEKQFITRFNVTAQPHQELRVHVDPSVPKRWRNYFKDGLEAWNSAFSLMGAGNVVRGVLPDSAEWPADYDPDDGRYSSVSWSVNVMSPYSLGLSKVDPRSGEIIKTDIIVSSGWVLGFLQELEEFPGFSAKLNSNAVRYEGRPGLFQRRDIPASFGAAAPTAPPSLASLSLLELATNLSRPQRLRRSSRKQSASFLAMNYWPPPPIEADDEHEEVADEDEKPSAGEASELDAAVKASAGEQLIGIPQLMGGARGRKGSDQQRPPSGVSPGAAAAAAAAAAADEDDDPSESLIYATARQTLGEKEWEAKVGALIQAMVTHEMGHSLGLRHNFRGSAGISVECLRSAECTAREGTSSSVMDYTPVNVFQDVGDSAENVLSSSIASTVVGQYDISAIRYGYSDIVGVDAGKSEDLPEVKQGLAQLLESAETLPSCSDEDIGDDPYCVPYDLAADPVAFYKLKLQQIAEKQETLMLSSVAPGESFTRYGTEFLGCVWSVKSISKQLQGFIGGSNVSRAHRRLDGSLPGHELVEVVPMAVQAEAMNTLLSLLEGGKDSSMLPSNGSLQFLVAVNEETGAFQSVNYRQMVVRLKKGLIEDLIAWELLDRLWRSNSLADNGLPFYMYLNSLKNVVFGPGFDKMKNETHWETQKTLVTGLMSLYTARCKYELPELIMTSTMRILTSISKEVATLQEVMAKVPETTAYGAYILDLSNSFADLKKSCADL